MESESTTICKMCYMDINPKAKKCPYCQHFQYKWSKVAFHPLFPLILMIIVMVIAIPAIIKIFQPIFYEGEPFSLYSSAVSVVETKMVFGTSASEHKSPTVVILGKIQNDSPISWEDVRIEATFFDKDGALIDATQKEEYSFLVNARDSGTFKLSFNREFPEVQYVSFKVRIISAKDERKKF